MQNSPARPEPVTTEESRPFWAAAAQGVLALRRCISCGRLAAPMAPRCLDCLGSEFVTVTLSGIAQLKGRTVLHVAGLPGREPPVTIVECLVEEDPRIVLIALDETGSTENLRPGDTIVLSFEDGGRGSFFAVADAEGAA